MPELVQRPLREYKLAPYGRKPGLAPALFACTRRERVGEPEFE